MNDTKRNTAPVDEGYYQIGTAAQPRSRGGPLMALLAGMVLLGGVITVMGLLNIPLVSYHEEEPDALLLQGADPTIGDVTTVDQTPRFAMELSSRDQDSAKTPQQIYAGCINAMVAVECDGVRSPGLVLTKEGYILTTYDAAQQHDDVTVELADRRSLSAQVIGTDAASGLAVLYVEAEDLPAPVFGDIATVEVGDTVCTFSDPLGNQAGAALTNSTVSSLSEDSLTAQELRHYAGPLLNQFGQVVGISLEGSDIAISSAAIKSIAEQLVDQGYVSGRPGLGIHWEAVSNLHKNYYELPGGLYINQVCTENGLEVGDILISLNGIPVDTEEKLLRALYACRVGDQVRLEIYRQEQHHSLTVTVVESKE